MRRNSGTFRAVSAGLFVAGLVAVAAVNAAPPQQELGVKQDRIMTEERAQVRDRERLQLPAEPAGPQGRGSQQSQQQWLNRYQYEYQRQSGPQYPPLQSREQYQRQLQDQYRYQQAPASRPLQGMTPPAGSWGGPRIGIGGGGRR